MKDNSPCRGIFQFLPFVVPIPRNPPDEVKTPPGVSPTDDTPRTLCLLAVVKLQIKKHDTIHIFLEQATMLYAFECARRRKNEVQKPSWTHSGGQDGVFRGANTGQGGAKRGSNLPIPGAKTEGMKNQRTKAPKERVQISPKSSSSR